MLGVFDSGAGGMLCALRLRKLLPTADIVFLKDTENAPYGTKTEEELETLIDRDVERLRGAGATAIFGACGTAGCVMIHKKENPRFFGVWNVLTPTATLACSQTKTGHVGVIATNYTVKSGTYRDLMKNVSPDVYVTEISAQPLVALAETPSHERNGAEVYRELSKIKKQFGAFPMDTLVLGCTHFSWLRGYIRKAFPQVTLVPCDEVGTIAFSEAIFEREKTGNGRFITL